MFKENINNYSKYIIYQANSKRSSFNLEGYEKVVTGESKKVILNENENKKQVSYNNKIIIHKTLDSTLKDYITKGKDNFMFEEIFDDDQIKKNNTVTTKKTNKTNKANNNTNNNIIVNSNTIK